MLDLTLFTEMVSVVARHVQRAGNPLPPFVVEAATEVPGKPWALMSVSPLPDGTQRLRYYPAYGADWFQIANRTPVIPMVWRLIRHELNHVQLAETIRAAMGWTIADAVYYSDRIERGLPVPEEVHRFRTWSEGFADIVSLQSLFDYEDNESGLTELAAVMSTHLGLDRIEEGELANEAIGVFAWRAGGLLAKLRTHDLLDQLDPAYLNLPFAIDRCHLASIGWQAQRLMQFERRSTSPTHYARGVVLIGATIKNGMSRETVFSTPMPDAYLREAAVGLLPACFK